MGLALTLFLVVVVGVQVHNEDGVWVRLNPETIEKYCRSNGHREGWCLQYNQHIGKTMLVPVEVRGHHNFQNS